MLVAGPVAHVFSRGIALFAEFWCHEIAGVAIREVFVCFFVPPNGVGGECERDALNGHFLDVTYPSEWLQGEKKGWRGMHKSKENAAG